MLALLSAWAVASSTLAQTESPAPPAEKPPAEAPKKSANPPAPAPDEAAAPAPEAPPPEPKKGTKKRASEEESAPEAPAEGVTHKRSNSKDKSEESAEETAPASEKDTAEAMKAAKRFFGDLLIGDARELVLTDCGLPFYVEDRKFTSNEDLLQEWLRNLRDKRTDLLTLYGIELFTPSEMEKKFGKPPARLSNIPWRSTHTFIAVANLSGHAGVALVQQSSRGWRVVGYHD